MKLLTRILNATGSHSAWAAINRRCFAVDDPRAGPLGPAHFAILPKFFLGIRSVIQDKIKDSHTLLSYWLRVAYVFL